MDRVKALQPNTHEKVYIPNEIFTDFNKNEQISAKNIAFLYTYYCLITYLFRYCKHSQLMYINNDVIKMVLGYAQGYDRLDFLIKKGGILDQNGYTESIRDFPIQYKMEDRWIEFEMYSQLDAETKEILNMPRNFHIKYPVKGFYRTEESKLEGLYDGTFYEIENTHLFDVNVFIKMMDDDIGVTGFYIYQYLRHKNDLFKQGYNIGREQLEKEIGIPSRTLSDYIKVLETKGYVDVERSVNKGVRTNANTYRVHKS